MAEKFEFQKTEFSIIKMDCPSEEQIIRMKLDGIDKIKSLNFDIPNRRLTIIHTDRYDDILSQLDDLKFGTTVVESYGVRDVEYVSNTSKERKLLWQILGINFSFFVIEVLTGCLSNSMGLIADSLDMLADSLVYSLALFAVGGTLKRKLTIAKASGYLQMLLAVFGFVEVIRRFLYNEGIPEFRTMIFISVLALIGNALCIYLLGKSKSKDAHIEASKIFTSNDVIVNLGVIIAGSLVYLTNSKYPDLIIGMIVFLIVGNGALRILRLSKGKMAAL